MIKQFNATIEASDRGGAFVTVPFDVEKTYGKKRVKIKATFDGEPYRGTLVRMGSPDHILIVLKDIREKIGKGPGDSIEVTIEEDLEPRTVTVPKDLQVRFRAHPAAGTFFSKLSYTHQREYVQWIEGAKRPDTRERRLKKTIELLTDGKKER